MLCLLPWKPGMYLLWSHNLVPVSPLDGSTGWPLPTAELVGCGFVLPLQFVFLSWHSCLLAGLWSRAQWWGWTPLLPAGGPPVLSLLPCQEAGERTLTCGCPPAPLLARDTVGMQGQGCPGRVWGVFLGVPQSWGTGRGGTGVKFLCVWRVPFFQPQQCALPIKSVCFPSAFPRCCTLTKPLRKMLCLHEAYDTRPCPCKLDTSYSLEMVRVSWGQAFGLSTFHSVARERQWWDEQLCILGVSLVNQSQALTSGRLGLPGVPLPFLLLLRQLSCGRSLPCLTQPALRELVQAPAPCTLLGAVFTSSSLTLQLLSWGEPQPLMSPTSWKRAPFERRVSCEFSKLAPEGGSAWGCSWACFRVLSPAHFSAPSYGLKKPI